MGDVRWPSSDWLNGYECGYRDAVGAQLDREDRQAAHREHARFLASLTPYAKLAERRGEPQRAEAHRALLAERGVR